MSNEFCFTYIIKINHENIDPTDSLSLQTIVSKVNNMFAIVEY